MHPWMPTVEPLLVTTSPQWSVFQNTKFPSQITLFRTSCKQLLISNCNHFWSSLTHPLSTHWPKGRFLYCNRSFAVFSTVFQHSCFCSCSIVLHHVVLGLPLSFSIWCPMHCSPSNGSPILSQHMSTSNVTSSGLFSCCLGLSVVEDPYLRWSWARKCKGFCAKKVVWRLDSLSRSCLTILQHLEPLRSEDNTQLL